MIGRLFSLAHDRWINLSHRQKLAFRSEFLAVVSERKKAANHNIVLAGSSNARVDTHSPWRHKKSLDEDRVRR
jgi:exonuclease III